MKVLGIESAGMVGGVALVDDSRVLAETIFEKGMVHGREIAPTVDEICRKTGVALRDLDLVAVDVGPGSYTGLRVGLAAGKALAFALGCSILGVASLDALAAAAASQAPKDATICAAVDARWNQIYGALYRGGDPPRRITDFFVEEPDAFLRRVPTGAFVVGNALDKYRDRFLAAGTQVSNGELRHPKPSVIARLAAMRRAAGETADAASLVPLYLRTTEAEQKLKKKN